MTTFYEIIKNGKLKSQKFSFLLYGTLSPGDYVGMGKNAVIPTKVGTQDFGFVDVYTRPDASFAGMRNNDTVFRWGGGKGGGDPLPIISG